MKEAYLYKETEKGKLHCYLCSFHCKIAEGHIGICGVRRNVDNKLYSLVYEKCISENLDPIEKKPLFHFLPASTSYSMATVGCNFRCLHCQNSEISQMVKDTGEIKGYELPVEKLVQNALLTDAKSIAYTYTEPTIFFEYAYDTAIIAKEKGLKNIFVSNGYMTKECVDMMKGVIDAVNVDLKSFDNEFYKKICGGAKVDYVLEAIDSLIEANIWVEITTLIIPTKNDDEEMLRRIAKWIAKRGTHIPWHISAFYPSYKMMDVPPTLPSTVLMARDIGLSEGLKHVYTGNLPSRFEDEDNNTYCPKCKELLIERQSYKTLVFWDEEGVCPKCDEKIQGIWS